VVSIVVPPLRQRKEDIPEFVAHFLLAAKTQYPQSPVERFSPEAFDKLSRQPWPGNVRELSHTVERLVLLGRNAEIGVGDLPEIPSATAGPADLEFSGKILPIRELQSRYAAWALAQVGGHRGKAAEPTWDRRQDAVEVASASQRRHGRGLICAGNGSTLTIDLSSSWRFPPTAATRIQPYAEHRSPVVIAEESRSHSIHGTRVIDTSVDIESQ